jgi:hypothetical protein
LSIVDTPFQSASQYCSCCGACARFMSWTAAAAGEHAGARALQGVCACVCVCVRACVYGCCAPQLGMHQAARCARVACTHRRRTT